MAISMKDYKKIANQIMKMGTFSDIYNCGCPTEHRPVNLCFQLSEPYIIGYKFYVSYMDHKWRIDYTLDNSVEIRTNMKSIVDIKTDRDMYCRVENIINEIRKKCGTK